MDGKYFYYLDVTDLRDELEAEEVSENLAQMIDDGSDTEECRRAAIILKMPEQESEDEPNAEAEKPGDEQERQALQVLAELREHENPLGRLGRESLRKHFRLCAERRWWRLNRGH